MGCFAMIYFDNAATTLIKPNEVYKAMLDSAKRCGNPGRSGHKPSMVAMERVFECRSNLADLFCVKEAERVVFTSNSTHALNIAIKSILKDGGHALISGYEHNSVVRPLEFMKCDGVTYTVVKSKLFDKCDAYRAFKDAFNNNKVSCVIINHISNVFGNEMPIEEIDDLCFRNNVPLIVDISQSAGINRIDVSSFKSVAYFCMPGHKALFGPQGTGVLICCNDKYLYSTMQGGTGSVSMSFNQPEFLPDIFESGTLNVPGISGLNAGVKFVGNIGLGTIERIHKKLTDYFVEKIRRINSVKCFTGETHNHGVISFMIVNRDCEDICEALAKCEICVRGGLHCSPLAHGMSETLERGLIRVSFSLFNKTLEIDSFCEILRKIIRNN